MKLKSLERSDFIGKFDGFLCQFSKHKFPNLKFGVIEMPVCAQSLQSCLTLCDPMDCSPPGSSIHGILQARIPEWIAISFSRGSS